MTNHPHRSRRRHSPTNQQVYQDGQRVWFVPLALGGFELFVLYRGAVYSVVLDDKHQAASPRGRATRLPETWDALGQAGGV